MTRLGKLQRAGKIHLRLVWTRHEDRPRGLILCRNTWQDFPETPMVDSRLWPWIPKSARCGTCARCRPIECRVTPEIELAIETALHGIASVFNPTHIHQPAGEHE